MSTRNHWDKVYTSKAVDAVSWYQTRPALCLELIAATGIGRDAPIIDVGGGASVLVDCLLDAGYTRPAVLDISPAALAHARGRLGARAAQVEWYAADVTEFAAPHRFELWHDRAVFHFLTGADQRRRYVQTLERTLAPQGHVIIATFAIDGPTRCSGLDTMRYDAGHLCAELGAAFELQDTRDETHRTPGGAEQRFTYFRFRRRAADVERP